MWESKMQGEQKCEEKIWKDIKWENSENKKREGKCEREILMQKKIREKIAWAEKMSWKIEEKMKGIRGEKIDDKFQEIIWEKICIERIIIDLEINVKHVTL